MKRKKITKAIFSQALEIYRQSVLVCVGVTSKEVCNKLKHWDKVDKTKNRNKKLIEFLEENDELFEKIDEGEVTGYSLYEHEIYLIIILPRVCDEWWYWETLIHEISHILDWLVGMKSLEKETEARAYLHEYLFHSIRRKLQGVDKL